MEGKDAKSMERGIKQISMIDMANKETRKQANNREGKQAQKQMKGGVCPKGYNPSKGTN